MRLKLLTGKSTPILSPSLLTSCNYMNEGCEGGWSLYDSFFAESGHLITASCAKEAQGKRKKVTCSTFEKCEPIAKINSSYFIGGGYGASTEKNMMKEILRNGIIVAGFKSNEYFEEYDSGIMSAKGINNVDDI